MAFIAEHSYKINNINTVYIDRALKPKIEVALKTLFKISE